MDKLTKKSKKKDIVEWLDENPDWYLVCHHRDKDVWAVQKNTNEAMVRLDSRSAIAAANDFDMDNSRTDHTKTCYKKRK